MAKAVYESSNDGDSGFSPMFPSPTARDGRVRANSKRTGQGQGRGSSRKFLHCKQCGYVFDRNKTDVSGGTESGDGGLSGIEIDSETYTVGGSSHTDTFASVRRVDPGAGCPQCGSKNGAANK